MLNFVSISPGSPGLYAPFLGPALNAPVQGRPFLLGCEIGRVACGALAASFQREGVRLLWVSVAPACQGRGMGRLMMGRFMEAVSASGAELAEAAFVLDGPAQIPAASLLRGAGFREAGELPCFSFPLSAALEGPLAAVPAGDPHVRSLSQLPAGAFQSLNREMAALTAPFRAGELLPDASLFWVEEGRITACVLLAPCGDGVELRWLYGSQPRALQHLLAGAMRAVERSVSPHAAVQVLPLEERVERLLCRLLAQPPRQTGVLRAFRWTRP